MSPPDPIPIMVLTTVSGANSPRSNAGLVSRDIANLLASDVSRLINDLGFTASGVNAMSSNGAVWIGSDGAYTNEFTNDSDESLILVVWGPWGSWVNKQQPQITLSLPAGAQTTLSFASGYSGAWTGIYSDTASVLKSNGQVSNTWGEFTMSMYGVVDVSREVNMSGHVMSIVGPTCTSNMSTCVFTCPAGENVCTTGFSLDNCNPATNPGAQSGVSPFDGSPSGGCGGLGNSAHLKTSLGK